MSGLAAALALTLQTQAMTPVSTADLRRLLDGVEAKTGRVVVMDRNEYFHPDGVYELWSRAQLFGRYTIEPGVVCRTIDPPLFPSGARPPVAPDCSRVLEDGEGRLFVAALTDPEGRQATEVRFRPMWDPR